MRPVSRRSPRPALERRGSVVFSPTGIGRRTPGMEGSPLSRARVSGPWAGEIREAAQPPPGPEQSRRAVRRPGPSRGCRPRCGPAVCAPTLRGNPAAVGNALLSARKPGSGLPSPPGPDPIREPAPDRGSEAGGQGRTADGAGKAQPGDPPGAVRRNRGAQPPGDPDPPLLPRRPREKSTGRGPCPPRSWGTQCPGHNARANHAQEHHAQEHHAQEQNAPGAAAAVRNAGAASGAGSSLPLPLRYTGKGQREAPGRRSGVSGWRKPGAGKASRVRLTGPAGRPDGRARGRLLPNLPVTEPVRRRTTSLSGPAGSSRAAGPRRVFRAVFCLRSFSAEY